MRRPVTCAPRLAVEWIEQMAKARGVEIKIEQNFKEGAWVGAGEPMLYLTGPFFHLVDLETIYLQKIGPPVSPPTTPITCAWSFPRPDFWRWRRHCAGTEMAELMAYGASVGSAKAKKKVDAVGFIGNATDATASYFERVEGLGTMPHALIGYAGSTLRAAEMFHATHPNTALVVLVDYFGTEVDDTLAVCRHFAEIAGAGDLSIRLDTHGGRFIEAWIWRRPTRCWNATRRTAFAVIAPTLNCAT